MGVTELVQKAATFQGTAPSQAPGELRRKMHERSRELWQSSGLAEMGAEKVARGLGWFSIGLGVAELLMPRAVARICGGQGKHTGLIRLYGLREIAAGLMIFSQGRRPAAGVWSRVAGDAMDLATLGAAFVNPRTSKAGVLFATASVLGVTAVDIMCAQELSLKAGSMTDEGAIRFKRSVSINRPAEELYRFWCDFQNLPRFMYHLQSVTVQGDGSSHWVTKGPGDTKIEWDSEVVEERENEFIAWRSTGGDVFNAGSVQFEPKPGGRGTIVRVDMQYFPPGGVAGTAFAMLFNRAPEQQVADDLRRFKQLIETGEIVRSDGSPEGAGQVMQRPGQPMGPEGNQ